MEYQGNAYPEPKYEYGMTHGRQLKRRAYVVYMNGTVSRLRRNTANAIEPGCEIIVPSKGERKKMTTAGAVGMSSSIASIAAMVASMVSLTK